MEKLDAGMATIHARFVFADYQTYIPVTVTMGDNCCDEHAELAAKQMIKLYAAELRTEDEGPVQIEWGAGVTTEGEANGD